MYARLVSFANADNDRRDQMLQTMREKVLPMLRQYDGYKGYIALHDAENSRAKAIILWDNKEAAETAEETLAERRRGLAGGVGLTIESEDLYEVPVFEPETA